MLDSAGSETLEWTETVVDLVGRQVRRSAPLTSGDRGEELFAYNAKGRTSNTANARLHSAMKGLGVGGTSQKSVGI